MSVKSIAYTFFESFLLVATLTAGKHPTIEEKVEAQTTPASRSSATDPVPTKRATTNAGSFTCNQFLTRFGTVPNVNPVRRDDGEMGTRLTWSDNGPYAMAITCRPDGTFADASFYMDRPSSSQVEEIFREGAARALCAAGNQIMPKCISAVESIMDRGSKLRTTHVYVDLNSKLHVDLARRNNLFEFSLGADKDFQGDLMVSVASLIWVDNDDRPIP